MPCCTPRYNAHVAFSGRGLAVPAAENWGCGDPARSGGIINYNVHFGEFRRGAVASTAAEVRSGMAALFATSQVPHRLCRVLSGPAVPAAEIWGGDLGRNGCVLRCTLYYNAHFAESGQGPPASAHEIWGCGGLSETTVFSNLDSLLQRTFCRVLFGTGHSGCRNQGLQDPVRNDAFFPTLKTTTSRKQCASGPSSVTHHVSPCSGTLGLELASRGKCTACGV